MPISILELARLQDGESISHVAHFQSLEDISLVKPIEASITVTKLSFSSFLVHTSTQAWLALQCDNCLASVTNKLPIDFSEIFSDNPTEEEWQIVRDEIDITNPLRQEILLRIPMKIVCESECKVTN